MKSIIKAKEAVKAKTRIAGIGDRAPIRKQADSDSEASNNDGATSPTTALILSSEV